MNRRSFLKALSAAGISLPSLPGLAATTPMGASTQESKARFFILIELQGGNDGLNTVVPYSDPVYAQLRPSIGFKRDQVLKLDEHTGLSPALNPLMPLWERGDVAIVQGVGYPRPNRSHFRSIEIWETASDSDETRIDGWLKPVTQSMQSGGTGDVKSLVLASDEGPLAGSSNDTIVFNNLTSFIKQAKNLEVHETDRSNAALDHILSVENTSRTAAQRFAQTLDLKRVKADSALPPKASRLLKQLDLVAQLIRQDVGPRVFKVGLGSFDTHANQPKRHASLMKQLSVALAHLQKTLTHSGNWSDVLIMTYSEFGRRAAENGTAGTDHGTAAPHFLVGGSVNGGLYGQPPNLSDLSNRDIGFTTDFRALYSTVSRSWFGQSLNDTPFSHFDTLPVIQGDTRS